MSNFDNIPEAKNNLRPMQIIGVGVALVPLAYVCGRFLTDLQLPTPWGFITAGIVAISLGALIGIPIGLFFGTLKPMFSPSADASRPYRRNTIEQQDKILEQLREELIQNKNLFEARKGNLSYLTRIEYLTGFWNAAKASGQLFVMQEPKLLNTIATAYYWLDQANHLENLAYESQFQAGPIIDNQSTSTHLIAEARLLDGPLGIALQAAIDAINDQIIADTRQQMVAQHLNNSRI